MNFFKKILPRFLVNYSHALWPFLGSLIYRFPSRNIKIIGITGTNGKTTVTHLATAILEEAGHKVASISSLRFKIGEREWKNELKMTMPGRLKLQKFLRDAVGAGCDYVVMEVTSEGIKQHRHRFIDFEVAVFTNLTPEHIEAHGGFENYKSAKGELFKKSKVSIINLDDENAEYFLNFPADKKIAYTQKNLTRSVKDSLVLKADNATMDSSGVEFSIGGLRFNLKLLGAFNVSNALAALCVGLSQEVAMEDMRRTFGKFRGVPGRMEVVANEPTVIVDYAHTPDALEKVYKTMKNAGSSTSRIEVEESRPKMICVLGAAGGGRDKWKRPKMGKIAAHYCDEIILTDEDPYDEDPKSIISQIEAGVKSEMPCEVCAVPGLPDRQAGQKHASKEEAHKEVVVILDRKKAVQEALGTARPSDVVVITGKGAEPWMMTKEGKVPWDDREIVKDFLKRNE